MTLPVDICHAPAVLSRAPEQRLARHRCTLGGGIAPVSRRALCRLARTVLG
jgi:hypothetical protein